MKIILLNPINNFQDRKIFKLNLIKIINKILISYQKRPSIIVTLLKILKIYIKLNLFLLNIICLELRHQILKIKNVIK